MHAGLRGRTFLYIFRARGAREPGGARALVRIVFGSAFGSVLAWPRGAVIL